MSKRALQLTVETLARRAVRREVRARRMAPASSRTCADCGGPALQYDHYKGYARRNWLIVEAVCRGCHVQREIKRGRYAKALEKPVHGRASTYINWSCRCSKCRAAHAATQRAGRARRAARLRGAA